MNGRRAAGRRVAGRAGYTLIELTIALAVGLLALALAGDLLLESQRRLVAAADRALDPVLTLALDQIRADVRASATVTGGLLGFESGFMELGGHPAGRVRYGVAAGNLVREVTLGGESAPEGQRIVLPGPLAWRWQAILGAKRQVEIEISYEKRVTRGLLEGAAQRRVVDTVAATTTLLLALRGSGGRSW